MKAVIAESFERIHRTNLVGMGVLPLQFLPEQNRETLALTGQESFDIVGVKDAITGSGVATVIARSPSGGEKRFEVHVRIDTPQEVEYYRNGGILPYVLRQIAAGAAAVAK